MEYADAHDMMLIENVDVQVGGPEPYNFNAHSRLTAIDTTSEVYPIRGSYIYYDCRRVAVYIGSDNTGKNCHSVARPTATGYCWATTFGNWDCFMIDDYHNEVVEDQPPPQD